ncbi:hypothetical protein MHC_02260 [Mycoplasma haemocanis str. Illinois]|uniref:Uncharacterized protein n=1 Tax=Mycoplasma haemocanis (strain Illinois) TaxID=1111676 RepID=H6N6P6_MYCHN|nr:hypothetical protein [Mycoplasma haemocanis]AEW45318.1 hypothetical protein MHC_02260 [Mycoplasma haemocanis str. Illinois]
MVGKYLIIGGIGAAGTGIVGTSVYLYGFREDTLETRVKNYFKNKKHMLVLSSSIRGEWLKFKEFYAHSKDEKPEGVDKEQIAKWCEDKLVSRDDSSFELVKRWCVIDSRTIQAKAAGEGRKPIPLLGADQAQAWKSAWSDYNSKKTNSGLEIKDSTFVSSSSSGGDATGGPALQKWCETKASQHMYEYPGEENGYEKYRIWCTKQG